MGIIIFSRADRRGPYDNVIQIGRISHRVSTEVTRGGTEGDIGLLATEK
jgi:hypothetical protein